MEAVTHRLAKARRIVIKVGSALLVEQKSGTVKQQWLTSLVDDVARLKAKGADIVLVSSGAIALGRFKLGFSKGKLELPQSQAAAAVGQIALAQAWAEELKARNIVAAQVLVTLNDTEERRRHLNARATLTTLLAQGAIPVINENDTVATSEIRYGDNDRLAARVASMMSADCLVLLSDIDGLYSAPPNQKNAVFIPEVKEITPEIEAMAGRPVSGLGSGGMITKIEAAKIALGAGCNMIIASGHAEHPLKRILDGERVTWFTASATPLQARKRWIAGSLQPVGRLVVDEGARSALIKGKSLLPAGVRDIVGLFGRGDTVSVVSTDGIEIARGMVAYDSGDAQKIKGLKSADIMKTLGAAGRDEIIHRDDLVMLTGDKT
jgi:glutamate 5-kinase